MILYIENKDSTRKLLELISEFSKIAGYKSIHRNHFHFYILTMKNQKEKLRINPIHHCNEKNSISRNKLNLRRQKNCTKKIIRHS